MARLEHFAVSKIHMYAAGKTRVEAADSAHYVDTLELVRPVFLKDGSVLHRIFIRARRPIDVAWICIPRGRWIRVVVGYLATSNDDVMREHAAHSFMKAASNRFIRHLELVPGPGVTRMQLGHRLLNKIESACRGVG